MVKIQSYWVDTALCVLKNWIKIFSVLIVFTSFIKIAYKIGKSCELIVLYVVHLLINTKPLLHNNYLPSEWIFKIWKWIYCEYKLRCLKIHLVTCRWMICMRGAYGIGGNSNINFFFNYFKYSSILISSDAKNVAWGLGFGVWGLGFGVWG